MRPDLLQQRLHGWASAHPGVFVLENTSHGVRLAEAATGKMLDLTADTVQSVESRANSASGDDYLVLLRDELPPLALAQAGFVFALDARNTGPLPATAPPVLSFRDFDRLHAHLRHVVPIAANRREAVELLMILVAAVDGARAAGLDAGPEETALEPMLQRLESEA